MWKIMVVLVILSLVGLFLPRYNLLQKATMSGDEYVLVKEGYWQPEDCQAEGKTFEHGYRCVKTSVWRSMVGNQRSYSREREIE